MIPARWAFRLRPRPEELLSSYLCRVAFAHGSQPYRFHRLYWPRMELWTRDIDRGVPLAVLAAACKTSGLSLPEVTDLTLAPEQAALVKNASIPGVTPFVLSLGIYHRARQHHGQQFCPDCLAEGSGFIKRWRLAFVFGCERHRRVLLDACPHCGAPPAPHRNLIPRLEACERCHGLLSAPAETAAQPSASAWALQRLLLSAAGVRASEARQDVDAYPQGSAATYRSLFSAVGDPRIHARLRASLGLPGLPEGSLERRRLEHRRVEQRALLIETVAAWLSNWPEAFRVGAQESRMTQRVFARLHLDGVVAAEIARLPSGQQRTRVTRSARPAAAWQRRKREKLEAYRERRARALLKSLT
ncbi:TniQ family protein [Spiribacter halobius]|uniref:TniQ domain-containing protein n=1 Tax=Sediminicurvatus halobius TaxID=2182432 RepID=A0A2U2N9S7_9GAMM|nr:TniQ family protein [Spiribacter halobius]PWG65699.1 hypothetical protein DEM34_00025 [Spiribacter halobius]UEX77734.1 TniQ family protein [Spiribacter halobius]